ncbi:MAG: polysaccharide lyase family 8 super-sandwich domain-containing protein [Phycisphaeraceae bacterium JB051]
MAVWCKNWLYLLGIGLMMHGMNAQAMGKFKGALMDAQQMQQTIERVLAVEPRRRDAKTIDWYVMKMDEKGNWPDIDYANKRRASWTPMDHTQRLKDMGLAYYDMKPNDPKREILKQKTILGIDRWLEMKLQSPNWWHNQIGVPLGFAIAGLSLSDALPDQTRDQMVALLKKHVRIGMTGANKVWLSQNVVLRGLLEGNASDVKAGIDSITDEIFVSRKEGIQPDMSFHQHGPILMSNSYGLAFLSTNLRFMQIVEGTANAFSPEKKAILTNLLLDGTGLMTFKNQTAAASMGRSSSRKNALKRNLAGYYRQLLACDPPRRDEVEKALKVQEGKQPYPAINRMYYASDFMIHQQPDWHLSIKLFSNRTYNSDGPVNTEGLENGYMSHGSAFLQRGGQEYLNLAGVWDWQYLPGTTVGVSPNYQGKLKKHNGSKITGGVSDGQVGTIGMTLNFDGLHANLAWFCFDDRYVVLGSAMKHDRNLPIVTTLDQCHLKSTIYLPGTQGIPVALADDVTGKLSDANWLWHDDVLYVNQGQSATCLGPRTQTGSWGRINISYRGEPNEKADVFRAWLEHTQPRFAYTVYPNVPVEKAAALAGAKDVHVVSQTESALAVYRADEKIGMAIFHQPSAVRFSDQWSVTVDQPVALILREASNKKTEISLASLTQTDASVTVTINGRAQTLALPDGQKAGSALTIRWD